MNIKLLLIIIPLAFSIASCNGQVSQKDSAQDDWAMRLDSPSKVSLDKWCSVDIKEITRKQKASSEGCDLYYYKDELHTGWACKIIADNPHMYRYEQFENGKMIRRVSYYDSGQIDADFRMKDCKNYGPSRMWLYNGKLYIDEFYIAPGIKHGIQKRFYDNGIIAQESSFDYGRLVEEKKFDRKGDRIITEN